MPFFTAAGDSINQLTEAQANLRLSHLERTLAQMDLLIIDEIGYVPFSEKGSPALLPGGGPEL